MRYSVGGEVAVRGAEVALQFDRVSGGVSDTSVCSQSAVASDACAPLISPREPRISVVPFRTSCPLMRGDVLALTL